MDLEANRNAGLMLSITRKVLGQNYADAEQHLVDSLELASSRVVDLNERANQERANAALIANFVGLLPRSGVTEQWHDFRNNTVVGHLQTDDERHIPGLMSSAVWISTATDQTRVLMPYYVVGVNSDAGSLLLGKPLHTESKMLGSDGPVGDRGELTTTYANRINNKLNAMPLVIAQLGREGGRLARGRAKKVVTLADNFHSEVSPDLVRSIYDPKTEDLKLVPDTKNCMVLPARPLNSLSNVEYLSDEQILKYNVITTLNLMAMRFGVSTLLQGLYEPMLDLTKPTPIK
jgi:hypothetical protein